MSVDAHIHLYTLKDVEQISWGKLECIRDIINDLFSLFLLTLVRLAAGMKSLCRWAVRLDQTFLVHLTSVEKMNFQPGKSIKVYINKFSKFCLQHFQVNLQLEFKSRWYEHQLEAWLRWAYEAWFQKDRPQQERLKPKSKARTPDDTALMEHYEAF